MLVLLNDDTLVTPGWLPRLIAPLRDPHDRACAGAVTNRIGNEAEIPASYRTWGELLEFAAERGAHARGRRCSTSAPLTMFCLALRRDACERIGPLDQRFEIGMLEDDDYSRRAREAGYRLVCAEDAFVHHFGETSFGKLVPTGALRRDPGGEQAPLRGEVGRAVAAVRAPPRTRDYEGLRERIRDARRRRGPRRGHRAGREQGRRRAAAARRRAARATSREAEDGSWAGHHPADSSEAVARARGDARRPAASSSCFPETGMWWLRALRRAAGAPRAALRRGRARRGRLRHLRAQRTRLVTRPRCTIVIPVHDRAGLTRRCLDAILADPPRRPFEIVVVDDASTDDTAALLARQPDAGALAEASGATAASRSPATTARPRRAASCSCS